MKLRQLEHFTLRVTPAALPQLLDYYTRVLGLVEGERPAFDFPGHWLYAGGQPLVHLAGTAAAAEPSGASSTGQGSTGGLDHVAFGARDLQRTRDHLRAQGVPWHEAPVPGMALHQVFLRDPLGLQIELTFDAAETGAAAE